MDRSKMKAVYHITTRNSKRYWTRVGIGFVNRDGSINVKLDAVPVNGELQVRDFADEESSVAAERSTNGAADLPVAQSA